MVLVNYHPSVTIEASMIGFMWSWQQKSISGTRARLVRLLKLPKDPGIIIIYLAFQRLEN